MSDPATFEAPPNYGATPATPQRLPVTFTGTGSEYFRIWIVNLLLTIVTIGIYSAWAKVRKMKYFYRNTHVDGAVFDYHGRPEAILRGRLIVFGLAFLYNISLQFSVVLGLVIGAGLALAMPWLMAQSQRFRLHNSSYRGLRFRFLGSVREAYLLLAAPLAVMVITFGWIAVIPMPEEEGADPSLLLLVVPGLSMLGLLLYWPYLHWRVKRYQHANAAFGSTQATFSGRPARFYAIYGTAVALVVGAGAALGGAAALAGPGGAGGLWVVVGFLVFYAVLLGIGPFVVARVQNHVWNSTHLGPVGFESAVHARRLAWITLSNLVLIIFTLGLFTPFAAVRVARYKLQSMTVLSADDLAQFVGAAAADVPATGEGAADLFDLDFAL